MARVFTGLFLFFTVAAMSTLAQDCEAGGGIRERRNSWNRPYTEESSPDVFYNFYQPGNGGSPAVAFPAPYPTPPRVGHQYTTYQPFMPNEWLYMHHRTYHQPYNMGMGLNRTKVRWHGTPIRTDIMNIRKFFSIAR
jgi:hypothetical protein